MGQHQWYMHLSQWYVHRSRLDGADTRVIKSAVQQLRKDCADKGINLVIGLGPTLLADLTDDVPNDFRAYETFVSTDGSGKEAKGTQEELLFWLNSEKRDEVWKAQWDARQALKGHMKVARETMTVIFLRRQKNLSSVGRPRRQCSSSGLTRPVTVCRPH